MINEFLLNETAQKLWEEHKATSLSYDFLCSKTDRTVDENKQMLELAIKRIKLLSNINKEF